MTKRYHMLFTGKMQGIGFRGRAKGLAHLHHIVGAARNLPDGRVEVIAEGVEQSLADFFCDIKHDFRKNITGCEFHESPSTHQYVDFSVEF